jgi:hypothetical protein
MQNQYKNSPDELKVWIVLEPSLVTVPPYAFCVSPEYRAMTIPEPPLPPVGPGPPNPPPPPPPLPVLAVAALPLALSVAPFPPPA